MKIKIGMDVVLKNGIECEVVDIYPTGTVYGMCNDDTGDVEFEPDDVAYILWGEEGDKEEESGTLSDWE